MYKPKPETLAGLGGSDGWMLQSGLFKVHWFLNAAQMQKRSRQAQGQIMIPAVLPLPKGEFAFTFPGFLWIMTSCPLLPRVKLLAKCDSVGGSFPLHFVCWLSFPLFAQLKEPRSRRTQSQECVVRSTQLRADGRVELFLFQQQKPVGSAHCLVHSFTQSSRFTFDNVQLWQLCFNMLITDADIITFPNRDYHIGDWCMI